MEYPQSLRSLEDQGRLFGTERPALHPRRRSGPAFDRALDEVRSRPERPACERGEDAEAPERAHAERATEAPRDEEAAPRPEAERELERPPAEPPAVRGEAEPAEVPAEAPAEAAEGAPAQEQSIPLAPGGFRAETIENAAGHPRAGGEVSEVRGGPVATGTDPDPVTYLNPILETAPERAPARPPARPETPVPQQGSVPESAPRSARPQAPAVGDPLPAEAAVRTPIESRVDAGRQPLERLENPALPPAPATPPGAPTGSETGRVQPPLQSTAAEEPLPEIDRLAAPVAEEGLEPALDKLSAPRARAAAAPAQTTAPLAAAPAPVESGPGGPEAARPTAVADPQPGRPALDPEAAADVLKQVRLQLWPGLRQASIQLHPANLGQVSIRLAMEGGRVRAVMRVEKPETLRALERHAPELRAALQAQGLEAESLDLALDSRESGADGSTRGSNEAGARQRASAATRTEAAPENEARPELLHTLLSETSVDTYA